MKNVQLLPEHPWFTRAAFVDRGGYFAGLGRVVVSSGSSSAGHSTPRKSHRFVVRLLSTVAELNETKLVTASGQRHWDLLGMSPVQRRQIT